MYADGGVLGFLTVMSCYKVFSRLVDEYLCFQSAFVSQVIWVIHPQL